MVELTDNQIADLAVLRDHCAALGAELVVIGAIAYQVHFPKESRHTADIDFAVALDLAEFGTGTAPHCQRLDPLCQPRTQVAKRPRNDHGSASSRTQAA